MRHGQAHAQASRDELRPLTELGAAQVYANALQHLNNINFDWIFVSPYLRAQQTFNQVKDAGLQFKQSKTVQWVTPDVPTTPALDELLSIKTDNLNILIICHQTFAGRLATHLCEGAQQGMHVDTAAIVKIETEVFASQCGILQHVYCV